MDIFGFIMKEISLILTVTSIVFIIINISAIVNQNKTAIKSERNERFRNAIEQLGSDKNAIILGGIYTLHRIAKEDESYRENVFNILCSYVRDTTIEEAYRVKYKEKPSEPIQTIVKILCVNKENLEIYRSLESKLRIDFNIYRAFKNRFRIFNKFEIDFSGAYLRNTILVGATLTGANLVKATLTGANLYKAILTNACLFNATLTGAGLEKATLTSANLVKATLTSARLQEATLAGANLEKATLTSANLSKAALTGVYLKEATLTGANLVKTTLTGAYSSKDIDYYNKSFEERIKSRIGKETDLNGIKGGYDPENPTFDGKPIFGSYTEEEAEEIIKKYKLYNS